MKTQKLCSCPISCQGSMEMYKCDLSAFWTQLRKITIQDNVLKGHLFHPFFQVFHNEDGSRSTMHQQRSIIAELLLSELFLTCDLIICIEVHLERSPVKRNYKSTGTCCQEVLIASQCWVFLIKKKIQEIFLLF